MKAIGGGVDASAGPMSLYRLPGPASASTSAETPRALVTRAPQRSSSAERDLNGLRLLDAAAELPSGGHSGVI